MKATVRVALAALTLLLPFAVVSLLQGRLFMAIGTGAIVAMLALNAWLVGRGRDHERVTLYVLVPCAMLFMVSVFRADGIIGALWCFPAILGSYCMLGRRRALLANGIILSVALPMTWSTLDPALSARVTATLIAVSVFAGVLLREIDSMRRRLHHQIEHDPLTGLLNRISLRERLETAIGRAAERGEPSALLAVDLDHFKSINDRLGHDAGDRVLREIARLLRASVRRGDAVFRLGGEEFLVLLRGTDAADARRRAEQLRDIVERAPILPHRTVTASVGVAALRPDDDRSSWARRADDRLYAAKRAGRNRVVWSDGRVERPSAKAAGVQAVLDDVG